MDEKFGLWHIRIARLPDGREAVGEYEMPMMGGYGTREYIVNDYQKRFPGYVLEIAWVYTDSLGRKRRRGSWESIERGK